MLTWSYDVSDGFPGGVMPISVVLLGKMGQAFFSGNLSVYFDMGYQFLIPSHCWEWAVSGWLGVFAQQQMCGELVANMDEWILSVVLEYLRVWVGCVRVALGWRKRPGLVFFTAHALYPCTLSAHWLLLGKVFCLKLHFQTVKVHRRKLMLSSVTVIGFKQTSRPVYSWVLRSIRSPPEYPVCSWTDFYLHGPRALTDQGGLL